MILSSPLLKGLRGVVHGFSTRLGGVSRGPYASMNLGRDVDVPDRVTENRRRFCLRAGFGPTEVVQVDQVHGTRAVLSSEAAGAEADAILTVQPNTPVGVRTADCVPILLAAQDPDSTVSCVAAVHAGWRGATAGVIELAVEAMEDNGARRGRLFAAVGPAIGLARFEVGDEVIEAASRSLGGDPPKTFRNERGKYHLDLIALVQEKLRRAGLEDDRIDTVGGCTHENRAMFFSHRRDRGDTGRMLSAIAFVEPDAVRTSSGG